MNQIVDTSAPVLKIAFKKGAVMQKESSLTIAYINGQESLLRVIA